MLLDEHKQPSIESYVWGCTDVCNRGCERLDLCEIFRLQWEKLEACSHGQMAAASFLELVGQGRNSRTEGGDKVWGRVDPQVCGRLAFLGAKNLVFKACCDSGNIVPNSS